MAKKQLLLGIDIGDKNMKLSVLNQRKNFTTVFAYGEYDIQTFMKNGRIESHDYIRDCIKTFIHEHKLGRPKVVLTIPNKNGDCSYTRIFDMVKLSKKEHQKALPIEIEDRFPINNIGDFIQAYQTISDTSDGKELKIIAVLAKKDVFSSYKEIFNDDKLSKLDVVIQSKTTSMMNTLKDDETVNLTVDMGYASTELIVSKGQKPLIVKSINFGGSLITEMISRMMNLSIEEAEEIKITEGRILKGNEDLAENDVQTTLSDIIFPQLGILFSEIEKAISITKSQLGLNIEKIYTCGGTSKLTYLNEYIGKTTKLDVTPLIPYFLEGNQDVNVKYNGMVYACSFGSSYQAFKAPLLPLSFTPKDFTKSKRMITTFIGGLLIALMILNVFMILQMKSIEKNLEIYNAKLSEYQNEDMNLQNEYNTLEITKQAKEQDRIRKEQENFQLAQLIKSKVDHIDYLKVIRDIIPTSVQTNEIVIDQFDLTIKGIAGTYSDIGYFVKELTYRPEFKDVDFTFEAVDKTEGKYVLRYFTYKITGKIIHDAQ